MAALCPGRKAGAVVVCGFALDRNGATDFPIFRAFRWIVNCSGPAGAWAMNSDRVIKSNMGFFNTGTWAGGTGRPETISKRGDNIGGVAGSCSVQGYTAESGMCQVHCQRLGRPGRDRLPVHR